MGYNISMNFYENARKPKGLGGKLILARMNVSHARVSEWGQSHLRLADGAAVLDIGCGGGANVAAMLKMFRGGRVDGLDYSMVSVEKTAKHNREAIKAGRCSVTQGDVSELPFADDSYNQLTAFETIYFWPKIEDSFREALRVLKPGGSFLICNESDGTDPADEKWCDVIGGMTIYSEEQIASLLEAAGFENIETDRIPKKRWLCATARKPCKKMK
jgi:SAM-dependent methyltransferase